MSQKYLRAIAMLALLCVPPGTIAEVTFEFTFFDVETGTGVGFDDPLLGADRRAALEETAREIGARIGQTATVEIGIAPSETDGSGPIGVAAATFVDTSPGVRDGEVYRRIVLGLPDTDPGLDGGMVFDFGYQVTLSGTPAPGETCFRDVVRHELTHALGFGSFLKADGTGFNGTTPDMYTRFDGMLTSDVGAGTGLPVVDEDGNLLLDGATYAAAHGSGLVFDGPATRAANGGLPLKLFGADPTHSGTAADVMFPSPAMGAVREDWSASDIAVLTDLGYTITEGTPDDDNDNGNGNDNGDDDSNANDNGDDDDDDDPMGEMAMPTCAACGSAGMPFAPLIALGIAGMKHSVSRRRRR